MWNDNLTLVSKLFSKIQPMTLMSVLLATWPFLPGKISVVVTDTDQFDRWLFDPICNPWRDPDKPIPAPAVSRVCNIIITTVADIDALILETQAHPDHAYRILMDYSTLLSPVLAHLEEHLKDQIGIVYLDKPWPKTVHYFNKPRMTAIHRLTEIATCSSTGNSYLNYGLFLYP